MTLVLRLIWLIGLAALIVGSRAAFPRHCRVNLTRTPQSVPPARAPTSPQPSLLTDLVAACYRGLQAHERPLHTRR
jgi:hypothetical protein